jgi:hypothetical protein
MSFRSHGFVDGGYMVTVVDRGADILRAGGRLSESTAAALKQEVRQRIEQGTFYGHIAYGGLVARKTS